MITTKSNSPEMTKVFAGIAKSFPAINVAVTNAAVFRASQFIRKFAIKHQNIKLNNSWTERSFRYDKATLAKPIAALGFTDKADYMRLLDAKAIRHAHRKNIAVPLRTLRAKMRSGKIPARYKPRALKKSRVVKEKGRMIIKARLDGKDQALYSLKPTTTYAKAVYFPFENVVHSTLNYINYQELAASELERAIGKLIHAHKI